MVNTNVTAVCCESQNNNAQRDSAKKRETRARTAEEFELGSS